MSNKSRNALPGFGLTLGFTLFYLSAVVLIPLGGLVLRTLNISFSDFWKFVWTERAIAAYKLSFGASLLAAAVNVVGGLLLAWVLSRYKFPFRRLMDGLVDLPFALPTAVGGLAIASIYAKNGWIGQFFAPGSRLGHYFGPTGLDLLYSRTGIVIALIFVSFPFVVRTVQPVLETMERDVEEAAATLGAGRLRTFWSVVLPPLIPSIVTGFTLAFARSLGEYGSIVFVSSHIQKKTEIAPMLIVERLDEYNYAGAISIAVFLMVASFACLGAINLVEALTRRFQR
ncbi:MAG TPA: sulfate ABC transporter permease subunit CysT [Candidatus Limnocylindria bacterium]|nr:sulfate ABC transporter permease subunit CysT [Candidatus Limnocylindria bacterium]